MSDSGFSRIRDSWICSFGTRIRTWHWQDSNSSMVRDSKHHLSRRGLSLSLVVSASHKMKRNPEEIGWKVETCPASSFRFQYFVEKLLILKCIRKGFANSLPTCLFVSSLLKVEGNSVWLWNLHWYIGVKLRVKIINCCVVYWYSGNTASFNAVE